MSAEGPALWAVEQIAQPLIERLRLHFGPGRPIDKPDRPQLLLSTAVRVIRAAAPTLEPLQAALAAPLADVPHAYYLPMEFARAMRAGIQVSRSSGHMQILCVIVVHAIPHAVFF